MPFYQLCPDLHGYPMDERTIAEIAAWAVLAVNARRGRVRRLALVAGGASAAVWPLLRAGQGVAFVQAVVAGVLFAAGYDPTTSCTGSTRCCRSRSG